MCAGPWLLRVFCSAAVAYDVHELLVEEKVLRQYRIDRPVDDTLGRAGFRTVGYRVELDSIRTSQCSTYEADERLNASQIGRTLARIERHPVVILDRLLSDDRGQAATAAGVRSNESNGGLRKPLNDAAPTVFDFFDAQIFRGFQRQLIRRSDIEHETHVGSRRSPTT